MQMTRFSMTAASDIQLKTVLKRSHAQMPPSSPAQCHMSGPLSSI
jgi:hypothetical protein